MLLLRSIYNSTTIISPWI